MYITDNIQSIKAELQIPKCFSESWRGIKKETSKERETDRDRQTHRQRERRWDIGPCYPAQADMGRNFTLSLNFLHVKDDFSSRSRRLFDKMDFMDP